jgi:hypothetical protein
MSEHKNGLNPFSAIDATLLTTKQAGVLLNVPPSTLGSWRSTRGGPMFIRLGFSSIRYRKSDLLAYIASRRARSFVDEARW